eukprot:TRINITY_DN381_c0_g1_i2.p2 TRINITY_DN381_c0_g1~~TRINITY_DN381_c0_g1_i2.p2  ORF type:complete len:71 (+),score=12.32 TRINITY_DN381_c0_g1_i2:324-536(+)
MLLHEIGKGHEDHSSDGHQLKKVEAPKRRHCNTKRLNDVFTKFRKATKATLSRKWLQFQAWAATIRRKEN